jgi:hypothetical protein
MYMETSTPVDIDHLVRLCITEHTPEELALGWLRYEALRRVNPRIFAEMNRRNLAGEFFDDIVTEVLLSWKNLKPPEQQVHMMNTTDPRLCMSKANVSDQERERKTL